MLCRSLLGALVVVGVSCSSAWAWGTGPVQWQGSYLGVNGGVATTSTKWRETDGLDEFDPVAFSGAGGTVGVQAGYNWLLQNAMLFGLEADINWADAKSTGSYCCGDGEDFSNSLNWFSTVRGRLGVLHNNALFFGTAGIAFGGWKHVATDDDFTETLFDTSSTRVGYALGGGVELALHDNWSMKAEFLYLDFGSQTLAGTSGGEADTYHAKVTDNAMVITVGANKHF
jgi:outer membrane immunogenic protein